MLPPSEIDESTEPIAVINAISIDYFDVARSTIAAGFRFHLEAQQSQSGQNFGHLAARHASDALWRIESVGSFVVAAPEVRRSFEFQKFHQDNS